MDRKIIAAQIRPSRREAAGLLPLLLLCAVPLESFADSLMMTTWYPAPYGVYSQLRSTGNSYFAYQGGNVGIGTLNPRGLLDLQSPANNNAALYLGKPAVAHGYIDSSDGLYFNINADNNSDGVRKAFVIGAQRQFGSGGTDLMLVLENGSVGIGTTNPPAWSKLAVTGAISLQDTASPNGATITSEPTGRPLWLKSGAGNFNGLLIYPNGNATLMGGCLNASSCSDARLKRDIRPLPENGGYLSKVLQLHGAQFYWKDQTDDRANIGLIAQEVERVIPEVVSSPIADGSKGISCTGLDAFLIEAVREQQQQIKTQSARIEALEKTLAEVRRK